MNRILGLPTIIEGQIKPIWQQTTYLSHEFKAKFPIIFAATKRAKNPMNIMNINIIESEPTFAKGSEITLLDVLDPNVESLEQCE